jgi:SAM-dependent methyltransferase
MDARERAAMLAADEHWWYRGRRRVIKAELERLPLPGAPRALDVGCGSGRTLDELARLGARASGVDTDPVCVRAAGERGHDARPGTATDLPYADASFDLVTCLDVLEHVPDDVGALAEMLRVTRPGGHLLLTVPAYQALWSRHDVVNLHQRRYRARTLAAVVETAGWTLVERTYFNSLVLGPAAVVRLTERLRTPGERYRSDLDVSPKRLNGVLELPLRAEAWAVRRGGRLPAGLSLLAACANE